MQGNIKALVRRSRRVVLAASFVCAAALSLQMEAQAQSGPEVRIARQFGIGNIPLMLMQDRKLLEKHAAKLGLSDVKVMWQQFAGGAVMNDALLSGNLDFAVAGPPPFLTMWARTRGTPREVLGVASLNAMPEYLMVRDPRIKSLGDFREGDKIVVPAIKVSSQAVALQMAAAKEWGIKEFDRLDKYTVALPLSDSAAIMLSGKGEIAGDFTVPPFSFREMKAGMRSLVDTYSIMDAPSTTILVYTTRKFHDANPKIIEAFLSALREAQASIGEDKRAAAETYLKISGYKEAVGDVVEMLSDPKVEFSSAPRGMMIYADFLHTTGAIKVKPTKWQDAFIPELHSLPGD